MKDEIENMIDVGREDMNGEDGDFGTVLYNTVTETFGIDTGVACEMGQEENITVCHIVYTLDGLAVWEIEDCKIVTDASKELYITAHDALAKLEKAAAIALENEEIEVGFVIYHFPTQEYGIVTEILEDEDEVIVAVNNKDLMVWEIGDVKIISNYEDTLNDYYITSWNDGKIEKDWYF